MPLRISVYCSSSPTIDKKYQELAFELGEAIGARSWNLVSGGGPIFNITDTAIVVAAFISVVLTARNIPPIKKEELI